MKRSKQRAIRKIELRVPDFKVDLSLLPKEDPPSLTNEFLSEQVPVELRSVAIESYHYFRTNYSRVSSDFGGQFVIRQPQGIDPVDIDAIHDSLARVIKSLRPFAVRLNISFAVFLEDTEAENPKQRFSIAYASANNFLMFETAMFIQNSEDFNSLFDRVSYQSVHQHLDLIRQTSKVRVHGIAAALINAFILPDALYEM